MQTTGLPFGIPDGSSAEPTIHPGDTGVATRRSRPLIDGLR
jgi:hypothetical protein